MAMQTICAFTWAVMLLAVAGCANGSGGNTSASSGSSTTAAAHVTLAGQVVFLRLTQLWKTEGDNSRQGGRVGARDATRP
jgi:hypothetical protein